MSVLQNKEFGTYHMPIATASRVIVIMAVGIPIFFFVGIFVVLFFKGYAPWEYPQLLLDGELTWYIHLLAWIFLPIWICLFWRKSLAAWNNPILIKEDGDNIILSDSPDPIRKSDIVDVHFHPYAAVRKLSIHLSDGRIIDQAAYLFSEDGYDVATRLRALSLAARH